MPQGSTPSSAAAVPLSSAVSAANSTANSAANNGNAIDNSQLLAAIDIGSNSFHLIVARNVLGALQPVQSRKEQVQLAAGLDDQLTLDDKAIKRGVECLEHMGQLLRDTAPDQVRIVATHTVRAAQNRDRFLALAEQAAGYPIEVISGREEARLIFQGVAHTEALSGRTMVVDIGGGSTEISVGMGARLTAAISVDLGCVAFKDQFFSSAASQSDAYLSAKRVAAGILSSAIDNDPQLRAALAAATSAAWYGTSGTIQSIATVLGANGWTHDVITRDAIARLEAAIVEDRWVLQAGMPGLAPDRADIFAGGVAILSACFEVLAIQSLHDVDVSLLQGMICRALFANPPADPRIDEQPMGEQYVDLREDSVAQLSRAFMVDHEQARRVEHCVLMLFKQAEPWWQDLRAQTPDLLEDYRHLLVWAARLHEVGAHISHRHYHRHGGYIIKHAEMPGFSDLHKSMLALLVRGHRRSMPGLAFQTFNDEIAAVLLHLVVLLRIAVILQRTHHDTDAPNAHITVLNADIQLNCGPGWLDSHPLSARELEVEQQQLATAGLQLVVL